MQLNVAAIL